MIYILVISTEGNISLYRLLPCLRFNYNRIDLKLQYQYTIKQKRRAKTGSKLSEERGMPISSAFRSVLAKYIPCGS